MKWNLLFMTMALAASSPAFSSEPPKEGITLSGLSLTVEGDSLRVRFRAHIGRQATEGQNYKLTLRPVLSGGGHELALRNIEVYGRRVELLEARSGLPARP